MPHPLRDVRNHGEFDNHWTHITDPAQVKETLAAIAIPDAGYNQLMVAKDPNNSYYAVYANTPKHHHRGLFTNPENEPIEASPVAGPLEERPHYEKIYDRGDFPAAFEK